jgi:hypothetical protein
VIRIEVSKKAVNDPEFSSRAAVWLLELIKQKPQGNDRYAQRNSKRCKRQLGKRIPLDYFDILVLCLPKKKIVNDRTSGCADKRRRNEPEVIA